MSRDINTILELWAQWVHRGGHSGAYQSVLHKMMVTGCVISSGGGSSAEIYTIEAEIEAAFFRLVKAEPYALNLFRVNVIRYEFGALTLGWPHDAPQAKKAERLGISLRTYRRHVKFCKDHIKTELKLNKWIINNGFKR
jgi:predicted DNA-binding protein (UPF0251 family)